jgi:heme exporter protein C
MSLATERRGAVVLGVLGVGLTLLFHYMVFFTVSTEATLGIVQRIFYVHVPSFWVAFLAFGMVALSGAVYLWIGEERLDQIGRAAAEGGIVFATIGLITGPLWARISWGTWWTWEPRLTLALLLWFIYVGYFMVRNATASPEQGRRYAAVVGIVGALNIPLIHVSVLWFRSLHPEPVVLNAAEGPSLPGDMLATLMVALAAWTALFFSFFLLRYSVLKLEAREEERSGSSVSDKGLAVR